MKLPNYTIWIFAAVMVLVAIVGLFPSNVTIGLGVLLSSLLIVFQVFLILMDTGAPPPK